MESIRSLLLLVLSLLVLVFLAMLPFYGIAYGITYHKDEERWNRIERTANSKSDEIVILIKDTQYKIATGNKRYIDGDQVAFAHLTDQIEATEVGVVTAQKTLNIFCSEVRKGVRNQSETQTTSYEELKY